MLVYSPPSMHVKYPARRTGNVPARYQHAQIYHELPLDLLNIIIPLKLSKNPSNSVPCWYTAPSACMLITPHGRAGNAAARYQHTQTYHKLPLDRKSVV